MGRKSRKDRSAARAARKALLRGVRVTRRLVGPPSRRAGIPRDQRIPDGPKPAERAQLHVIQYGPDYFDEREVKTPDECFPAARPGVITWLNIDGLQDAQLLQSLAERIDLHPLVLEDVVTVGQRPKQEEYEGQHYIVLRMLEFSQEKAEVVPEQISLVVGKDYVLSFQEAPGDVWDPVRERLRAGKSSVRSKGADHLAYMLMDAIVDEYFKVVEIVGDQLDTIEAQVLADPGRETIGEIHHLKGELLVMRKAVWPLRDMFNTLIRDESAHFSAETKIFLRDLYDHAFQVIDAVEVMRDVVGGLVEVYLTIVSNRMNEVMKVLTVIGTVFIPLTFIVGVYGMNFDYFPELHMKWSYPVLWVIMVAIAGSMLVYFRRRGWF
jgi:magnesium transporter